jgi:hypothetical protein
MKVVDSTDSVMTITINNPVAQDVYIQVDIDNEKASSQCVPKRSRVLIGGLTYFIGGGTANRGYFKLAAGQKTISIDMQWAVGNTRRNLVIKTYAKTNVPFSLGGA